MTNGDRFAKTQFEGGILAMLMSFSLTAASKGDALTILALPCVALLILRTFMWKGGVVPPIGYICAFLSVCGAAMTFISFLKYAERISSVESYVIFIASLFLVLFFAIDANNSIWLYGEVVFFPCAVIFIVSAVKNGVCESIDSGIGISPIFILGSAVLLFDSCMEQRKKNEADTAFAAIICGSVFGAVFGTVDICGGALCATIYLSAQTAGIAAMLSLSRGFLYKRIKNKNGG